MRNVKHLLGLWMFWSLLLGGPLALADDDEDLLVESTDVSGEQFADFVAYAHEAAEAEDPSAPLSVRLMDRLNFYRKTVNAVRLNHLGKESNAEDAANLAFLLPVSHTAETLSGPVYFVYGLMSGVPKAILYPTAAFLGSMAVPGIDWGCIVFIGTYLGSKDFRGVISGFRIYTVKIAKGVAPYVGATQFMQRLVVHTAVDAHLRKALSKPQFADFIHGDPNLVHEFSFLSGKSEPMAKLRLGRINESDFTLQEIRFNEQLLSKYFKYDDYRELRAHFRKILSPFGWDIRDAALVAFDELWAKRSARLTSSLPVSSVEQVIAGSRVRWSKKMGGDHHHHHEHKPGEACHHEMEVIREVLSGTNVSNGASEIKVTFVPNAVQLKPVRYYRLSLALKAIPQEICEVGVVWRDAACQGIRTLGSGTVWLASHPQYVVYGPVLALAKTADFGVKATFTTTKISLQVVQSAVGAVTTLVTKGEAAYVWSLQRALGIGGWVKSCIGWIAEGMNSGEETSPPPFVNSDRQ